MCSTKSTKDGRHNMGETVIVGILLDGTRVVLLSRSLRIYSKDLRNDTVPV